MPLLAYAIAARASLNVTVAPQSEKGKSAEGSALARQFANPEPVITAWAPGASRESRLAEFTIPLSASLGLSNPVSIRTTRWALGVPKLESKTTNAPSLERQARAVLQ